MGQILLQGKYSDAKVFTDNVDETTISQIINLLNQDFTDGSKIRIMSDCHAGKGCVIGFTADLGEKVVPNLVGVDIGCGMLAVNLGQVGIDFGFLDRNIRKFVPFGRAINSKPDEIWDLYLEDLNCWNDLKNTQNFAKACGSLGGGNHFIEIDEDEKGGRWLVIHTGSRNLGKQIAEHYQRLAIESLNGKQIIKEESDRLVEHYKSIGRTDMISKALAQLKSGRKTYPEDLCYLTGDLKSDYLQDMKLCQEYATLNRIIIANNILETTFDIDFDLSEFEYIESVHNYINFDDGIIRKGATSARRGERLIIPLNMRDGSLICTGKGNPDWNFSAPHGAGRVLSRNQAKRELSLDMFKEEMQDVYTTSVSRDTLDESPMAYKPMNDIIDNIDDTVSIDMIIKPVYNFKASE